MNVSKKSNKSSIFSETEEEKESVSSNNIGAEKKNNSKKILSIPIPEDNNQIEKKENDSDNNNIKGLTSYNYIELKYITEINQNTLSLNLEKILTNQNSFTNLIKKIFHRILKTNSSYQSFQEMHKTLLQTKTKFLDDQFPPNINSLIKGYQTKSKNEKNKNNFNDKTLGEILLNNYKDISWKRESDFSYNNNSNPNNATSNTSIFPNDNIFINKIIYNKLSNPNLFYVLNILGSNPEHIKKLFINTKKDSTCIFGVNLCQNGNYQQVVIDDFFPYNQKLNTKIYLTEEKGCLWPQILEKAYAKLYGSYNLISGKSTENILKDFTCAPVITIDYFGDNLALELLNAYNKGWIILAGAGDTEASQMLLKDLGLDPQTDHEILLVYKLTDENINQITSNSLNISTSDDYNIVLKIRNLTGKVEWIGDWSDYSGLWNDNFKNILNYNPNEKNFYMNLKDFKLYFSKIKICKYNENYKYKSIEVNQDLDEYVLIKIKTNKITEHKSDNKMLSYISFIQEEKKNNKSDKIIFGLGRLILCKLIDDELQYISGKMGQEREIILEQNIPFKGEQYLLFCQLDKSDNLKKFVISIYSPQNLDIEIIPNETYPNILENIYKSCARLSGKGEYLEGGKINCYKYSDTLPEGYSYIYIENHEDDTTYIEDIKYTKFEGLKLLPPFQGTGYHVEVGPNSEQIILIKHLDLSEYSLIFSYQSNVIYGEQTLVNNTKEKGNKKKRMDKKTKSEVDIFVYTYKYSFGLCYYYENKTKDKRLKEKLNIKNNSNIEFYKQPEGTNEINIILEPGQNYFVELKSKTVFWKVQPYISYNIETINN